MAEKNNAELSDNELEAVSGGFTNVPLPKKGSAEYMEKWANGCPNCGSKRISYAVTDSTGGYYCNDCCFAEGRGQIIKISL